MVEVLNERNESHSYAARVLDISEGGMQLETRDPIAIVGAEIRVQFALTERIYIHAKIRQADSIEVALGEDESGESESVVKWSDGTTGKFGVEFVELEPEVRAKLKKLVERLIEVNGDVTKV